MRFDGSNMYSFLHVHVFDSIRLQCVETVSKMAHVERKTLGIVWFYYINDISCISCWICGRNKIKIGKPDFLSARNDVFPSC